MFIQDLMKLVKQLAPYFINKSTKLLNDSGRPCISNGVAEELCAPVMTSKTPVRTGQIAVTEAGALITSKKNQDGTYEWNSSASGGVTSFKSRVGDVNPESGDYDTSKITETTNKKYVTDEEKTKLSLLSGTNTGDETGMRIAGIINNSDEDTSIADTDKFALSKDGASLLKKVTWARIKTGLKSYFDTLYNNYILPKATASVLGGIKVGSNLSIDPDGVLSASAGGYTLPTASAIVKGGVKIGSGLTMTGEVLSATGGDVVSIETSSSEDQLVLFKGVSGKAIKACTLSGIPKLANGIVSIATAGTDYMLPTGTAMAGVINAQSEETTILDADKIPISKDGSSTLKYSTYSKLKAGLYSYISSTLKKYHGVDNVGAMSINIGFTNTYFTLAAGENSYYYNGVKFVTTDSITIDLRSNTYRGDSTSTYSGNKNIYVYFKDSTGNLYWSDKEFDIRNSVPVAMVIGTNIYYEAHGYTRNLDWHENAHNTIGARYASGFDQIYPEAGSNQSLILLSDGVYYDEDIKYELDEINNLSNCNYLNSYTPLGFQNSDLPYCGSKDNPKLVIPGSADIIMNDAKYAQFYCYVTNNIDRPLLIVSGQVEYNTIAQARLDPLPNISAYIPTPEIKLLYSFMFKGDGSYIESVDYRTVASLRGNLVQPIPTAEQIAFTSDEGLTSVNVNNAIDEVYSEIKNNWVATVIENVDLNTFATYGRFITGYNVTNKPISNATYVIENIVGFTSSPSVQRAYPLTTNNESTLNSYYRINTNLGWTPWYLVYTSSNFAPNILSFPIQTSLPTLNSNLQLFAKNNAGKSFLTTLDPNNALCELNSSIWSKNITIWKPNDVGTSTPFGSSWVIQFNGGSNAIGAWDASYFLTSMNRVHFTSGTTLNYFRNIIGQQNQCFRGNIDNTGGFFASFRFGVWGHSGTNQAMMVGLSTIAGNIPAIPSGVFNMIALTKDAADTTWQLCLSNASQLSKINTGEAITSGYAYDFQIYCAPNSNKVCIRLVRLNDNTVIINNVEYVDTAYHLPVKTTWMRAIAGIRNTAAATTNSLALMGIYIESNY